MKKNYVIAILVAIVLFLLFNRRVSGAYVNSLTGMTSTTTSTTTSTSSKPKK